MTATKQARTSIHRVIYVTGPDREVTPMAVEPLIDIRKFPSYFVGDSIDRGIFKPETETHATVEQVRALLSDAEYYCHQYGPDMCPPGLKASARAVIRHATAAIAKAESNT